MEFKIRKETIYEFFLLFLAFNLCFVSFAWLPFVSTLRYVFVLLLGILICFRLPEFIRSMVKLDVLLIMYIVCVLISGFINRNAHVITHTVLSSVAHALTSLELVFVLGYVLKNRGLKFLTSVLLVLIAICLVINDITLFAFPRLFFRNSEELYFVGNKFNVSFLHILAVYFVIAENRHQNRKIIARVAVFSLLFLLLVFVSIKVNCMTGVTAAVFIIILGILPSGFFKSPVSVSIVTVLAVLFPLLSSFVLSLPVVKFFVVDILDRSLTLTGRTSIFLRIPAILKGHFLFGYGYGTANETWSSYIFYMPNAQNGLLNNIVEIGLFATVLFTAYMIHGVYNFGKLDIRSRMQIQPFIKFLYILLIISAIEISTDLSYFFIVILINETAKAYGTVLLSADDALTAR